MCVSLTEDEDPRDVFYIAKTTSEANVPVGNEVVWTKVNGSACEANFEVKSVNPIKLGRVKKREFI